MNPPENSVRAAFQMIKNHNVPILTKPLILSCLLTLLLLCGSVFASDYYTEPEVYQMRPDPAKEMALDCIGATGIKARFYPGVILKVEGFTEKSPAEGKMKVGEIIAGVNGVELKGINPLVALGEALTSAEATDGRMVFDIKADQDAPSRKVTVMIPVLGSYSETWPLKCQKSDKIIKAAAEYYAHDPGFKQQFFRDSGIPSALACLFLLSTGDDSYLPVVKAYFASFPKEVNHIGDHTWNNGYNGIACAEYYLRTGDREVLPILQYYCDDAKNRQFFGCGWSHWGRDLNPGYVAGGLVNAAGTQMLTTLLLGKACGVEVDEKALHGALKLWYRFAGHGEVPYGDHRPEGGLGSNGRDGMSAAAMRIATLAEGNTERYRMALNYLSKSTLVSYPMMITGHGDEGRGDGIWRGMASSHMLDTKPAEYHQAMNRLRWFHDLSRRPSGAFGIAGCQGFDDVGSGAGVALAYTAPLKTLAITGAPRSKHAKKFKLPEAIWGNQADLAFLSTEHGKPFGDYGKEDPVEVSLKLLGTAYRKPETDLNLVPKKEILKHVYHQHHVFRTQAAKALRVIGAFDDLERLLGDADPRVRRAALDGMCDYNYWFHMGRDPMRPEQFTPGMIKAVVKILRNREEALWVTDAALSVMSLMPTETLRDHLQGIMPWTSHDDWWLRQSAFSALATAARDPALASRVLPTLLDMLSKEGHTMPRDGMVRKLDFLLNELGPDSPGGRQILAAHRKAAEQREIILGARAGEGEYDVGASIDVLIRESPADLHTLAGVLRNRLDEFSTRYLVKLTNDLLAAAPKAPEGGRAKLETLLYDDYRPVLVARWKTQPNSMELIDTILSVLALKDPDAGWQELGKERYTDRVWRFTTFEPTGNDVLHAREKKRFRAVTLPAELLGWSEPGFDDSAWKQGKAPIGVGLFGEKHLSLPNASPWGDDEFVLMRSTVELATTDYDFFRIKVLSNQGYEIFLNGTKVFGYGWWNDTPGYGHIMLHDVQKTLLKKGMNHLAVRAGSDRFHNGIHVGQIDVYLEGLRKKDLLDQGRR